MSIRIEWDHNQNRFIRRRHWWEDRAQEAVNGFCICCRCVCRCYIYGVRNVTACVCVCMVSALCLQKMLNGMSVIIVGFLHDARLILQCDGPHFFLSLTLQHRIAHAHTVAQCGPSRSRTAFLTWNDSGYDQLNFSSRWKRTWKSSANIRQTEYCVPSTANR